MKVANNQYEQHYTISDHLGSARMTLKADGNNLPIVLQYDSYTPFGLEIAGLSYAGASVNPNKYNGKELQSELNLNWYDYGARFYDPHICKWHSVDSLAEKMQSWLPYNYCINNPLIFINPDGIDPIYGKNILDNVKLIGDDAKKSGKSYLY